jgi:adenylate cyclase class IV
MSDEPHFEVERKFRLTDEEFDLMPARLVEDLNFVKMREVTETDTFFPAEKPGDMVRIRDEKCGAKTVHYLTQKTWKIVGDSKERSEQEEKLSANVRNCMIAVGERMNDGQELLTLFKTRTFYERLQKSDPGAKKVLVVLDTLPDLGSYSGHYMEVEILVPEGADVEAARTQILGIAKALLQGEERAPMEISYMNMLIESKKQTV